MSESKSRAWRVFIVKRPQAGVWTMRVSGSGLLGVTVHARSTLEIAQVQFGLAGSTTLDQSPRRGVENIVRIDMSRGTTQVEASIVDATFRKLAALPRAPNSMDGTYFSGFTPGAAPFRIMVEGKGADGVAFQRVHGPLFTPE